MWSMSLCFASQNQFPHFFCLYSESHSVITYTSDERVIKIVMKNGRLPRKRYVLCISQGKSIILNGKQQCAALEMYFDLGVIVLGIYIDFGANILGFSVNLGVFIPGN